MALNLNEYIKMSYKRPNRKVLEGLGASEDLIEYLMETPENTNLNVMGSITGSSSGDDSGEVWFTSSDYWDDEFSNRIFSFNTSDDESIAYLHAKELYENYENYQIFLNGENLPVLDTTQSFTSGIAWFDKPGELATKMFSAGYSGRGEYGVSVYYPDATTAPTSVEVSVKAK